jgi:hypothetical protein
VVRRIGGFFVTYADVADQLDCPFVSDLAGFDLEYVIETAYLQKSPAADGLLDNLLALRSSRNGQPIQARIRAKLIAGGFFSEHGFPEALERVRRDLETVPAEELSAAAHHLVSIQKRAYWEVTDRAINIEWTNKLRRRHIRALAEAIRSGGPVPSSVPRSESDH